MLIDGQHSALVTYSPAAAGLVSLFYGALLTLTHLTGISGNKNLQAFWQNWQRVCPGINELIEGAVLAIFCR